jgi:hypothetical protein
MQPTLKIAVLTTAIAIIFRTFMIFLHLVDYSSRGLIRVLQISQNVVPSGFSSANFYALSMA